MGTVRTAERPRRQPEAVLHDDSKGSEGIAVRSFGLRAEESMGATTSSLDQAGSWA
jgi:hypothetical protein